jgi:ribosomal protein S12 methylthiotransferase
MKDTHSRNARPLSVGFVSLGCPKNLVDSQRMAGVLLSENLRFAPTPEEADVVIVNTCAFIEKAREESMGAILSACRLKAQGGCRAVIVAGCFPQRYREQLKAALPDVDAFVGLDALERIGSVVRRVAAGKRDVMEVAAQSTRLFEPRHPAPVFSTGAYAYLKVAEGCDHRCSFCAIPGIRGRHRSRPLDRVVREAEQLLEGGMRELDIVSQDVTAYGHDLGDGTNLAALLRALGALGGHFWIRLLYGYPSRVTQELLETIGTLAQVCHYLDLPIQHSHPDILRAMGRADTVRCLDTMAPRIRAALPDVVLRTTCLVGFPGEKEEHFRHLLNFVRATEFDHVGVFTYSAEEDTRAIALPGRPSARVAAERMDRLMRAQRAIVDRKSAAKIGTEAQVLLEKPAPGRKNAWLARSYREAPEIDGTITVTRAPAGARRGDFIKARYTRHSGYDMHAVAAEYAQRTL